MNIIADFPRARAAEIEIEIKAHILAEYGIEDPLLQRVEMVSNAID